MSDQKWIRYGAITLCLAGALAAVYMIGRFSVGLLLPFIIALLVAALARAGARRLANRLRVSERVLSAILVVLILVTVVSLCYLFFSRVLLELQQLLQQLLADSDDPEGMLARVFGFFQYLGERFSLVGGGFLETFIGDPQAFFAEQLRNFLSGLSERLPAGVAALLGALPRILLFLMVTVIACFYFALDYPHVVAVTYRLVPARMREQLPSWRRSVGEFAGKYLKAYCLLFLLTLFELWLGLLLLRVRYSFLLSLLIALLDVLPILGVGTVLVPWALVSLLAGNTYLGIGLLLLYAVVTIVRQVAEPHLVGKSLGLHPILMLIAFYAGLRLFGVAGLLVGPALMLLWKAIWQSRQRIP